MNAAKIRGNGVRDVYRRPRFSLNTRRDKFFRHDTDDGVHVAAERNRFTENLLVAVELLHPQIVTKHHYKRRAVLVVFSRDETSALRSYAKRFKEPAGHLSNLELNRFITAGVSQRLHDHATEPAERFTLRFNVSEIGRRLVVPETDQSRRIVVRQWSQQHGINDTEDRGVHSNAKGDGDNSHSGERRTLRETAETVADIFD